jgi:hypothetical protein
VTELKIKSKFNIMKKNVFVIAVLAVAMLFSTEISAQSFRGLDKSPADIAMYSTKADGPVMKVIYSRPQLKGRTVASLTPAGKVWRVGANESTEVTFYKNVMFGGKSVKAGTYTMFAIPGAKEWTIIISSKLHTWGSGSYKPANDVVRVKAKVSKGDKSVEAFSIGYSKTGAVYFGWGNTIVTTSVK